MEEGTFHKALGIYEIQTLVFNILPRVLGM